MKNRLISIFISTAILFSISAHAIDSTEVSFVTIPTAEDQTAIISAMSYYGIPGSIEFELLYDHTNTAAFILGTTPDSYMIMDRASKVALEWGEGNPYSAYINERKWYGAVLNYYVKSDDSNSYVDIRTGNVLTTLPNTELTLDTSSTLSFSGNGDVAVASYTPAGSPVILPNSMNKIRKVAFRYNDDDSCSAIATCLALNYLDQTISDSIVPDHNEPETLISETYNASYYPKAIRFLEYIRDTCAMGTDTLPVNLTNAMRNYSDFRGYDIAMSYSIDRYDVMADIDNDLPCLISTVGNVEQHKNHTMLIYGYQTYSDTNVIGWLVHTGYYYDLTNSNGSYYLEERWINPNLGSCVLYHFTSSNW